MPLHTIAILHYSGPPGVGGVEATIAAHARLLADDGHAVRIVAGTGAAPDPRIELRLIPLLGSRHPRIEAVNEELSCGDRSPAFHQLVSDLTVALEDALAGCNVAMVHNVHTLHKNLAFTAALAHLHETGRAPRLLAWAHDFAWRDPLYLPQLHDGWPWSLLREPWPGVQYVAVSHDRQQMLANLLQIAPQTITVVPPGIDVARLLKLAQETASLVQQHNILAADPLLVLPARVTRRKNIELALRIVAALRDQMPAPLLVITGPPGPHNPSNTAYLAELQRLRTQLQAPVLFLYEILQTPDGLPQPVSDAMIADWLSLADGLLFPSKAEGFGMPLIEAGLRGIPIFCSDIPPFREIAGGSALYFGLEEPPPDIAHRIATALRDDPGYTLRQQVRQHYTWQAIYQRDIKPLLELVDSSFV
jgi:glycosyltransferase involved in cell wall biosynthesis